MVTEDLRGVIRDFGMVKTIASLGIGVSPTGWGQNAAAGYQAKELFMEDSRKTPMSDVYAFGGTMLAVMSGKGPFYQFAEKQRGTIVLRIYNNITPRPDDHPKLQATDPLWDLLRKCWDPSPPYRPPMTEIATELSALVSKPVAPASLRSFPL
ncbi:hypothetical protein FRB90_010938 [Tulasnella sp. 427]|nr:hypothetical protein FRB90_010938 [Tulasnella sp. 427]